MHNNNLNETTASTPIYSEANILAAAQDYIRSGYSVTPIQYQDKKPMLPQWQKCKLTEVDLSVHFATTRRNIGIVLGEQSDGLVDVDIDDDDTLLLAPHFLPSTALVFGRKSRKDSHWLYRCLTATPKKFTDHENNMLVEIRGNNQQTVFPPSVHVSGERIEFSRKEAATSITFFLAI